MGVETRTKAIFVTGLAPQKHTGGDLRAFLPGLTSRDAAQPPSYSKTLAVRALFIQF